MATAISGTPVVSGTAYGPAAWIESAPAAHGPFPTIPHAKREAEALRFAQAADAVTTRLMERAQTAGGAAAGILEMTATLAADPAIAADVLASIESGHAAEEATIEAFDSYIRRFEHGSPLMCERAIDLEDVCNRILAELTGAEEPGIIAPDTPVILLADDISPANAASLDTDLVLGLATVGGGPTSHTAVIARQLGIPCVVAARALHDIADGELMLLNGTTGVIEADPDQALAQSRMASERAWQERVRTWRGPAATADGEVIELLVNIRSGLGAERAAESEAEGVGLFRTEMSFLGRTEQPSVEYQERAYRRAIEAFDGRRIIFRTLDASSDKALHFLDLDGEHNPALGVRGLRITGRRPDVLESQLDALAAAARGHEGDVWVVAPMISTVAESAWFAGLARERGLVPGLMVEVPSAAVMIEKFLGDVDFVTIGSNDLTQYVMAADKLSSHLAEYTDPWQPAAVALINRVARACIQARKYVSICGDGASDPLLSCAFVGMGIRSLSMPRTSISGVGARLASVPLAACEEAAEAVLAAHDAGEARAKVQAILGA